MTINEIQDLIKFVSKSGVSEIEIEDKGFKLTIKTPPFKKGKQQIEVITSEAAQVPIQQVIAAPAPVQAAAPAAPVQAAPVAETTTNYIEVKSPMVGTFYSSAAPGKPAFINIGDKITAGQTVCMIEAMKLFNEIESEVSGTIVKILATDSSPVEYDQPLFLVDPS